MNPSPLVSVIIPYYNGLEHVKESITSILNQSFSNFELLVLDDGSDINIEELLLSFDDKRIRYIRGSNVGLCKNINRSLHLAKGEYIARLDQDDISEPDRLEKQVNILKNNIDVDCVFTRITKFGSKRGLERRIIKQFLPALKEFDPISDGCQVNSTMMVKNSVLVSLNGYRQEYYPSDDWDLELRMSENYRVCILDDTLVRYRFHASANTYRTFQLMQNTRRWAEENHKRRSEGLREISLMKFQEFNDNTIRKRIRHYCKDNSKRHLRIAGGFYMDGCYFRAISHMFASFLFHPPTYIKRLLIVSKVGQ